MAVEPALDRLAKQRSFHLLPALVEASRSRAAAVAIKAQVQADTSIWDLHLLHQQTPEETPQAAELLCPPNRDQKSAYLTRLAEV